MLSREAPKIYHNLCKNVVLHSCLILKKSVVLMQRLARTDVNHDHVPILDEYAYVAVWSELCTTKDAWCEIICLLLSLQQEVFVHKSGSKCMHLI